MHLLTREAVRVYGRALRQDGVLLFHVSNRYIDLEPVVAAAAQAEGWHAALHFYSPTEEEKADFATVSVWIALSRDPAKLRGIAALADKGNEWEKLAARPDFGGWTDDYASILPLLKMWDD
jgi:hypothetical protein